MPTHKQWLFVVNLKPSKRNGLDKDRHINLKQLRVVDHSRIEDHLGWLEKRYWSQIKVALSIVFDL